MARSQPPDDAMIVQWSPGLEPPTHKKPPRWQEETHDPNRGMDVRSLTGMFRGVGGPRETEALERALTDPRSPGWIEFNSSNVKAAVYDFVEQLIFVWFRNGNIYFYPRDDSTWNAFLGADSKGKFLWAVLRDKGTDMQVYGIMPFGLPW